MISIVSRGSSAVERLAHNQGVGGSIPPPATIYAIVFAPLVAVALVWLGFHLAQATGRRIRGRRPKPLLHSKTVWLAVTLVLLGLGDLAKKPGPVTRDELAGVAIAAALGVIRAAMPDVVSGVKVLDRNNNRQEVADGQ